MRSAAPTPRQIEFLQAMATYVADHGFPPTVRTLGSLLGLRSTNSVNDQLELLEKKGCVTRAFNKARGWHLTDLAYAFLGLPVPQAIVEQPSTLPATGTVDVGSRCADCGTHVFGDVRVCPRALTHAGAA